MKLLAIGDIFGRPGRFVFKSFLPHLIDEYRIDFIMANAENAAGGRGLTPRVTDEILSSRVDVLTTGNHIWEHEDIRPYLDSHPILRPYNVDEVLPGRGYGVFTTHAGFRVAVVCLQGVVFMDDKGKKATNPLKAMDKLISELKGMSDSIVVDFHAEATSEKRALAWFVDGRVAAVLGTHTHVQTADEEVMPGGTAYISDLGMTGPHASVIGLDKDTAINRFLTGEKKQFKVSENGARLEGVIVEIDERTGLSTSIHRIKRS